MAVTRTNIGNLWFNYVGDYSHTATYRKDDVVVWNNTDYLNIREGDTTGVRPKQNTQYYFNVESQEDATDSTVKFTLDSGDSTPVEYAPTLYVRRGDKIVFYQDNNNNDDHPLAISTSATSQSSNFLDDGVSYYHNNDMVSRSDYILTTKFNPKTARKVVVQFTKDTPDEIYYFSTEDASFGGKIVVADWDTWRPLRNSFKWRNFHVNTSGTTYYENDIVKVRHAINNNTGTDYEEAQVRETLATYICVREHTTDGTERYLPYNRNKDLDGGRYWLKMGAEFESDDHNYESVGAIETVDNIGAADSARKAGIYRQVSAKSTSGSGTVGQFKITVQGDGSILDVHQFSAADSSRTAGTYTGVSQSSSDGAGTGAEFDIVVDSTGAVTSVKLVDKRNKVAVPKGGTGYVNDEEITIADGSLGGGGAADFTFRVNGVGVAGQATVEVERSVWDSRRDKRYFNDFGGYAGGEGNAVDDTITIDGDIFGGGADLTFDVATISKSTRGSSSHFTGNPYECVGLINQGPLGDDNRYYRLAGQNPHFQCVNHGIFIGGTGTVWSWGSNSTGQNGFNHDLATGNQMSFSFYDWYRSTDNGGTGVHTTPDGETPRVIQIEGGYSACMALMNNGEVYHWGYGGHGQSGDGSTSNRDFPVRVGGTNQNVYEASNSSTHKFKDVRIKRIWVSSACSSYNSTTHSCYALDEDGELWSWGYNGYGQLGNGNTTQQTTPVKIDKSSNFNNSEVVAFWTAGDSYPHCFALTAEGKFYAWGRNADGQLGIGNTTDQSSPVEVTATNAVAFTDDGVGRIKKLLVESRSDDGRSAILTERGTIYWCGQGNYGWHGDGNTTSVNTWTLSTNGPGNSSNADCVNMWFTGAAHYPNMWVEDSLGNISVAGYNGYGQMGTGNTTDSTTFVTPKVQIGSNTQRNLKNVKYFASYDHHNDTSVKCLTWDGHVFTTGRNNYGMGAIGHNSGNVSDRDAENGKEHFNDYCFQPIKQPNSMVGNVEEIVGAGYGDNSDTCYGFFMYKTFHNRFYMNGYGGSYLQGTSDGQHWNTPHTPILG